MKPKITSISNLFMLGQALLLLLAGTGTFSYGQTPYNQQENFLKANSVWVGGYKSGVDFNSGSPVAIQSEMGGIEGCASVADPVTGQLLLYSDGFRCWDRNNQVMPNGDSLLGNGIEHTTTQGVCIVPVIDSVGKYYLFSLNYEGNTPSLYYSVVDMSLNGGLGNIVPGRKNIVLDSSSLSEAMIAVPGDNCDIWLLVHETQTPVFKAYHITADGLDTVAVLSTAGQSMQGVSAYRTGGMAVSPDRSMIAISSGNGFNTIPNQLGTLVAKFDAATGEVFDAIPLHWNSTYSVAFSPDNSKLYTAGVATADPGISQYDLSVFDSAAIVSSRTVIVDTLWSYLGFGMYLPRTPTLLRLYDGKIYFIVGQDGGLSLACINDPNLSGNAVNYDSTVFQFPGTVFYESVWHAISNEVVYPLTPDTTYQLAMDTAFCPGNELVIAGAPGYSGYLWDDGSTNQTRTVATAGTYWVLNEDACHSRLDTFVVDVYDFIQPVITVSNFTLSTGTTYATYQWMLNGSVIAGATQAEYTVSENGDYQVIVSTTDGCVDTSEIYVVDNVGIADPTDIGQHITIYPNPSTDLIYIEAPVLVNVSLCGIEGKGLKYIRNARRISVSDLAKGIYLLKVYDQQGRLIRTEKITKAL